MNIKILARLSGGFSAVLLATSVVQAQQPLSIVITGTRTAQTVDEALAPVTVISRQQIEQRPGATVSDILSRTPGVNVTSNGGIGSRQSVFLRGTESDHVLILIDGLRVGSATTGTTSIADISVDQVERIEIVRGPRSSLYGSEAIGGVIQIFTRRPAGAGMATNLAVSTGSHSSYGIDAGVSGRGDKTWFRANISSLDSDGFNACSGKPFPDGGGCFTDEPDADGYQNKSVGFSGGVQLSQGANLTINALHSASKLDFDGSFENQSESNNQLLSAKLELAATDRWNTSLIVGQSQDHSDNFKDGAFSSRFNTDRKQLSLQNDIRVSNTGTLTFGADHYQDEVNGTTEYAVSSRDNTGLFAQYLNQFGATDLQVSLRSDDNEQFGSQSTGGITLGHNFGESSDGGGLRWTASWGSAFKAPTFNELYFPNFGNPNLSAESAESFDIGLSGRSGKTAFSAHVYETTVENLIAFDAAVNKPANIGEASISGVELSVATQISGWNLDLGLTVQEPKQTGAGDNNGKILARRAQNIANLGVSRQWGALNIGFDLHSQGHSFDDLANTKRLDGFTTVDMNIAYALTQNWALDVSIKNLFDESYETALFYNQDGLNGMLSLRYTPN